MAITGAQVRAARMLLGWSQTRLAGLSGVSGSSIGKFESGGKLAVLLQSTIQLALVDAGVEFSPDPPGVRLTSSAVIPAPWDPPPGDEHG
jgi:transcriptional regulator with XRE-family HTH domain